MLSKNTFTSLFINLAISLALGALFIFGINGDVTALHNIGIFLAWFFGIISVLALMVIDRSSEAWKVLENRPPWYKFVSLIVGFATSLALVGHGMFFVGLLNLSGDFKQLYIMTGMGGNDE